MTEQQTTPFEELDMPRKNVHGVTEQGYRVYRNVVEYMVVEATSALEALEKSGIAKPHKITRHDPLADNVLSLKIAKKLLGINVIHPENAPAAAAIVPPELAAAPAAPVEAQSAAPAPIAEEALIPVVEAGEKVLSNEEVDKLLNG
jgi:hypothetical protein